MAQATIQRQALGGGQFEPAEPLAARLAERVGHRRALAEIARQHSMRLDLRARPSTHDPLTPAGQPPQCTGSLVGRPHRIKETRHQQLGQRPSIEPIGLGPRLSDRPELARVGDHHPDPVALEHLDDPVGARRRFHRDHVIRRQALREQFQRRHPRSRASAERIWSRSAIATSQKSRCTSNPSPRTTLLSSEFDRERGGTLDNDGFVLSAHRGKSQGRPRTTSSSQLISQIGLPNRISQKPHVPGTRRLPAGPDGSFIPRQRQVLHRPTRSPRRSPSSRPATSASRPTRRAGTGRSNASSARWKTNGRTAASGQTPPPATAHCHRSSATSPLAPSQRRRRPSAHHPRSAGLEAGQLIWPSVCQVGSTKGPQMRVLLVVRGGGWPRTPLTCTSKAAQVLACAMSAPPCLRSGPRPSLDPQPAHLMRGCRPSHHHRTPDRPAIWSSPSRSTTAATAVATTSSPRRQRPPCHSARERRRRPLRSRLVLPGPVRLSGCR